MDDRIFYCENCGGVMEFDVASQSLKCPNCDTVIPIVNEAERIEEHRLTHHAMQTVRAEEKTTQTMECRGCGAKIEVEPESTATECPYCGSSYVLAGKQEDAVIPDGVLPFQVDRERVGELFHRWLKGRWMAPGELKHLYQRERLQGVYLPYWTFDAGAQARYSAMGGRRRTVTRRGRDGKTTHQVVTGWYPTSGTVRKNFDDVLVPASEKLDRELLRRVGCFGTKQVASYAPEYLSGYAAECYTVDLVAYICPCKFRDDCDFVSLGGGDEECKESIKEVAEISVMIFPPFYNSEYPIQSYFVFLVYALEPSFMKCKKELVQSPFPLNK